MGGASLSAKVKAIFVFMVTGENGGQPDIWSKLLAFFMVTGENGGQPDIWTSS